MLRRLFIFVWLIVLCCFAAHACAVAAFDERVEFYVNQVKPLLTTKCYSCHGAINQEAELRLDTGTSIRKGGDNGTAIDLQNMNASLLLQRITAEDPDERMPPESDALTSDQIDVIEKWIRDGGHAPENELPQVDPAKHWAFQPLGKVEPPGSADTLPIDAFIRQRLNQAGLKLAQPANATSLVRRLFFDLHGLPPTPDEIEQFELAFARDSQAAVQDLVDRLLDSPRYGERWAQHWLDIVRYADTDGFEVNTPRPNAWPYRDYVIRAFNDDKPYDEFVFEQLAGDSVGEDAATGFLVAAAALLPGQIGKDEASERLARQDALDEMIVGTSGTFLGLTVGCARCHDHKFDPISQRDYYAMQAFFAGVEYGDRPLKDESQQQRETESAKLTPEIAALTKKLHKYQPLAFTGKTIIVDDEDAARVTVLAKKNGHGVNPPGTGRGYKDDPGDATRLSNLSRGRYTWWTNKPGEDVFTWNPNVAGQFRVWISWGVHGSGVHTNDARYVIDRDGDLQTRDDQNEIAQIDQYYFSGVREGQSATTPLWSGLFDTGVHDFTETTRIVLRGGVTGTGITADVIVIQEVSGNTATTTGLPSLRDPVDPGGNVERFSPIAAKFVRFTTNATSNNNRYEPCIDELQIYTAGDAPKNIALAAHGTKPTSSGNRAETGKHQLKHINDGKHGNSFSWISNEIGRGWVQLEFPQAETIDRIEWARDREGNFKDRLPVDYQIDVSLDGINWTAVAGSGDRIPLGTPTDEVQSLARNVPAGRDIKNLIGEFKTLQLRKTELDRQPMVFAGKMREPDITYVLLRGDPEQPADKIEAQTPSLFGGENFSSSNEQQRRIALSKWIIDSENPLTARVIVNRVWQFHFGRGLVGTPSDFGLNGEPPSHPELLDWLAQRLIDDGWSLKNLHRLILSSATYQQSSKINSRAQSIDADNRLLWRFPSRRLEAEAIRDSILYVSGNLNLEMGGPGFDFFKTRGGLSGFPPVEEFSPKELRRMIYAHKIRMESVPVFGAFDCPDAGQSTPHRSWSTTAIQALNLFNSPFIVKQAERFAEHVTSEAGDSIDRQVELAFLKALGRRPTDVELATTTRVTEENGLSVVCRVLFNSNEFLFIP